MTARSIPPTTDGDGAFEFPNVKAGRYELQVHAMGFADLKMTSLQLDARQTLRADVVLKLASSTQTVEVAGDSGPVINTENATIGDSKDFSQITNLPVNYRGAMSVSLIVARSSDPIASATVTSPILQPAACSTSPRSIRFLPVR